MDRGIVTLTFRNPDTVVFECSRRRLPIQQVVSLLWVQLVTRIRTLALQMRSCLHQQRLGQFLSVPEFTR